MPELPDITIYVEALDSRIGGETLERIRLTSPFLLRTVEPPIEAASGRHVLSIRRIGKRIAIGLEGDLWLVIHLMIAGRLHWKKPPVALAPRRDLAGFDFSAGTLTLTEAGSKRRASLHVLSGEAELRALDPGGIDVFAASAAEFAEAIGRENHTLKRVLTDPHVLSGIGNAYSDEILHRAKLSPVALSQKLSEDELSRLHRETRTVLQEWTERLRRESAGKFPEKVTALRPEMAVHGKYGEPCPMCQTKVQRIRHADNETNYCPGCQTGGRLLADRALSRLLKSDWPRSLDEWEQRLRAQGS